MTTPRTKLFLIKHTVSAISSRVKETLVAAYGREEAIKYVVNKYALHLSNYPFDPHVECDEICIETATKKVIF
jgi:hypothetical protein